MAKEDEEAFVEFVKKRRNVCMFLWCSSTPSPVCLDSLPERDVEGWFSIYFWDMDNSPPPIFKYYEKIGYSIDQLNSEVIEFSRSVIDGTVLRHGRIWASFERLSGDHLVQKSEHLKKWFRQLAGWIRRSAVRREQMGYVLPGAAKFCEEGGTLD